MEEEEKKPWYKKYWWAIALVVVLVVVFSKQEKSSADDEGATTVKIGEILKTDYFEVTVNNVEVADEINTGNPYSSLKSDADSRYIILNVTFKNIDNESRMIIDGSLFVDYNGKTYEFDKSEVVLAEGWGIMLDQINPLIKKNTKIVYKIPREIKGTVYYKPGRADEKITLGDI